MMKTWQSVNGFSVLGVLLTLLLVACPPATQPDTSLPTISISSPANNSSITATSVQIAGSVIDNIAVTSLEYTLNGGTAQTATVANPFGFVVNNLVVGSNTIVVTAKDAAGNKQSSTISITRSAASAVLTSLQEAEDSNNTIESGLVIHNCTVCSGGRDIGFIGNGKSLQFNALSAPNSGTYYLRIYFLNGDATVRNGDMSVNGSTPKRIVFPTLGSWSQVGFLEIPILLIASTNNTIKFSSTSYAADLDKIELSTSASPTNIINVNVNGSGSVSSNPSSIICGATCNGSFTTGSSITLIATPSAGATFQNWSGACSGNSTICTLTLNSNSTVNASFSTLPISDITPPTVSLTSSSTNVTSASNIVLTANASDNVGVSKVEFFDGNTKLGEDTAAPFERIISLTSADNGSKSYTAKAFDAAGNTANSNSVAIIVGIVTKKQISIVFVGSGSGVIDINGQTCQANCTKEYPVNTTLNLKAISSADSTFVYWYGNGSVNNNDGTCDRSNIVNCQLTLADNISIAATFNPDGWIAQPVSLYFSPTRLVSLLLNTEIELELRMENPGTELRAGDIILNYDSTKIMITSVTNGTLFRNLIHDFGTNTLYMGFWEDNPILNVKGNGIVAKIRLKTISSGASEIRFECDEAKARTTKLVDSTANNFSIVECEKMVAIKIIAK
jgi:hypothetical protein